MRKNSNILWITAIALGWSFDFLFWKHAAGINFALFAILCLIGGLLILRLANSRIASRTLWLIPIVLFFAAVTFVRAEPLTVSLGFLFTLFSMAVLAITALGGRWFSYSLRDYAAGFLKLAGSIISRPLIFNAEVRREQEDIAMRHPGVNPWPVLRGILIALPVLAIFGALLASADVIFGHDLDSFMKLFKLETLPEHIFRLVYIVVIGYAISGVFLHAATRSKDEKLPGEGKPIISPFLGSTEDGIVLGSLIVLFGAFVIVQFRYFFGGQANINLEGYTYSEYARRGFGELITVAFFSLLLILGLGAITRRGSERQRWLYSGLSAVIVVLVMVMLVSAYQRLVLYESAYGYSRLRTYAHVFLVWIGVLLAAVVVLEILRQERAFASVALMASLGFAASLSVLNVDGVIVKQNVYRATQGEGLDVPYLASLSADAVLVLVELFQSPSTPGFTRDAVGAVLFCRLRSDPTPSIRDWRSFTVSGLQADEAMRQIRGKLAQYHVVNDQQEFLTPGSVLYRCYQGGD